MNWPRWSTNAQSRAAGGQSSGLERDVQARTLGRLQRRSEELLQLVDALRGGEGGRPISASRAGESRFLAPDEP